MKSGSGLINDFWWLPENVAVEDLRIIVGHHHPLTDEDEPIKIQWFHSLDNKGGISPEIKHYSLDFLNQWRSTCKDTNVYRTLKLFDCKTGEAIFLGPFLIDIDSSGWDTGSNSFRENLSDAQATARNIMDHLIKNLGLALRDARILFSGRKGFNIEIRPQALGIKGSIAEQAELSYKKQEEITRAVSVYNTDSIARTSVDKVYGNRFGYRLRHPCIRLHNSINKWICSDGKAATRKKIEVTYEQLWKKSAVEISSESEMQAQLG